MSIDHGVLSLGFKFVDGPPEVKWCVADVPPDLPGVYPAIEPYDFLTSSTASLPNVALRESDMLSRSVMERTEAYHRLREIGMPLGAVLGMRYTVEPSWHGCIYLIRSRQHSFSDRNRELLQRLAPSFAAAIRSCHRFGEAALRSAPLEAALRREGVEVIVMEAPATEIARTAGVEALLACWFAAPERTRGGLPEPLAAVLARLAATSPLAAPAPPPWVRRGPASELRVDFIHLPVGSRILWALELREISTTLAPPAWAARLTARQLQVTELVLRGWDNALIAQELACSVGTVKKHLQRIYDALGVPSRAALLSRAARER